MVGRGPQEEVEPVTLKQPDPAKADPKYATTYQASRGGHYPPPKVPKENRK